MGLSLGREGENNISTGLKSRGGTECTLMVTSKSLCFLIFGYVHSPRTPLLFCFFFPLRYDIEQERKKFKILLFGELSVYNSDFCV